MQKKRTEVGYNFYETSEQQEIELLPDSLANFTFPEEALSTTKFLLLELHKLSVFQLNI